MSEKFKKTTRAVCITTLIATAITTCPQRPPVSPTGSSPPTENASRDSGVPKREREKNGSAVYSVPQEAEQDNPEAHLLAAKQLHFHMESPRDLFYNGAPGNDNDKYLDLSINEEKNNRFGLQQSRPGSALEFNRETSYIMPKGTLRYGSRTQDSFSFDTPKPTKGVVVLDTSDSMCRNWSNFHDYEFNQQKVRLYLPAVLALGISNYYINGLHTEIAGLNFSSATIVTPFTRDMQLLAREDTKKQCGSTQIDYAKLRDVFKSSSANLDVYILSDEGIFSENMMRATIDRLQSIREDNELRRVFFIEWRIGKDAQPKDFVLQEKGISNTFYGAITSFENINQLVDELNNKVGSRAHAR